MNREMKSDSRLCVPRWLLRRAFNLLVIIVFGSLLFVGITLFLSGNWLYSYVATSVSLMCIPAVAHDLPPRDRLNASVAMAFALAGLVGFVILYFQLFHFWWFDAIFNDKGSGEGGLILFALTGSVVGFLLGRRVTSFRLKPR